MPEAGLYEDMVSEDRWVLSCLRKRGERGEVFTGLAYCLPLQKLITLAAATGTPSSSVLRSVKSLERQQLIKHDGSQFLGSHEIHEIALLEAGLELDALNDPEYSGLYAQVLVLVESLSLGTVVTATSLSASLGCAQSLVEVALVSLERSRYLKSHQGATAIYTVC